MAWASLDDKFHSNPKVTQVGNAGAGLFARALSYCADYLTDGFVPYGWAQETGSRVLCQRLTDVGLWVKVERGYSIPDYLDFNPPKEWVEEHRSDVSQKRAIAGRKGARARWGDSKRDSKQDGNRIANDMATGVATGMANEWPHAPTHANNPERDLHQGSSKKDSAHDAAALTQDLEQLGLNGKSVAAAQAEPERARAWLAKTKTEATTSPAGYWRKGFETGAWPTPILTATLNHEQSHPFECEHCGVRHRTESKLTDHLHNVHAEPEAAPMPEPAAPPATNTDDDIPF